jgi:perosamine synthetase
MFAVVIDKNRFGISKDELQILLKNKGIDTRDFFYSPSEQPVLRKIVKKTNFPNATYLSKNGLYLPSGLAITQEQIVFVCDVIKKMKNN